MHQGLEYGHPPVNGYYGFFPDSYDQLRQEMSTFSTTGWCDLTRLDVAYLVVSRDWLTPERIALLGQDPGLPYPSFRTRQKLFTRFLPNQIANIPSQFLPLAKGVVQMS